MREDAESLIASHFEEIVASYDDEMPDWVDVVARSSTQARRRPQRRWIRRRAFVALAAAGVAAAIALAVPWNKSSGPLDNLALAAIGYGPVIHVIGESPTGIEVIDLSTGASQAQVQRQEVWYSADQGLLHTTAYTGATLVDDTLATPQGTFTPQGIVYDCAWIAAHPVAATQAHVSCNASGQNGSTPRQIPRPMPTLDPGLSGFVDGYQQALASGAAHADGSGKVEGRPVDWLVLDTSNGRERVALDKISHKPILVTNDNGWSLQITTIETTAFGASDFQRPSPSEVAAHPSSAEADDAQALALDAPDIAKALPGAVWPGSAVDGVPLVRAEAQSLQATYANKALPRQTGSGVELDYGSLSADGHLDRTQPYIEINSAPSASLAMAYMWRTQVEPSAGAMLLSTSAPSTAYGLHGKAIPEPGLSVGQLIMNGVYTTIRSSSRDLVITAARASRAAGS